MGVSRMPIREVLRQLEMEGLVRIEPHRGAIIIPVSIEDVEEIYFLRALLEGIAVEKSLPFLEGGGPLKTGKSGEANGSLAGQ